MQSHLILFSINFDKFQHKKEDTIGQDVHRIS